MDVLRTLWNHFFDCKLRETKEVVLCDLSNYSYLNDKPLNEYIIPKDTTDLHLGIWFNQIIHPGDISEGVKRIVFGFNFQHSIHKGIIPSSVTHLEFGFWCVSKLQIGDIPHGITHLTLGYQYNHRIDPMIIPTTVTHLKFGNIFNRVLEVGSIPPNVKYLTFGDQYNQPLLPNVIPEGVIHIVFGYHYNKSLSTPFTIPQSTTHITIGFHFVPCLQRNEIPSHVKNIHLILPYKYINETRDPLPQQITQLSFCNSFNAEIDEGYIPEGVIYLDFGEEFNQTLRPQVIPNSVRYLMFGDEYSQPLKDVLPNHWMVIVVSVAYPYISTLNKDKYFVFTKHGNRIYPLGQNILDIPAPNSIDKDRFCNVLTEFESHLQNRNGWVGNAIFRELSEYIFHPNRVEKMCNTYNMDLEEWVECI